MNQSALEDLYEKELGKQLLTYVKDLKPNLNSTLKSQACLIVEEISAVLKRADPYSGDQQLIEDIILILHNYGIDTGVCHDY